MSPSGVCANHVFRCSYAITLNHGCMARSDYHTSSPIWQLQFFDLVDTRGTAVKNHCLKRVFLADSRTQRNTRKEVDRTTSDLKHGSQQIFSLNVFKTSTFNLSKKFKSPRNDFILSMTSHLHTCTAKACARCVSLVLAGLRHSDASGDLQRHDGKLHYWASCMGRTVRK